MDFILSRAPTESEGAEEIPSQGRDITTREDVRNEMKTQARCLRRQYILIRKFAQSSASLSSLRPGRTAQYGRRGPIKRILSLQLFAQCRRNFLFRFVEKMPVPANEVHVGRRCISSSAVAKAGRMAYHLAVMRVG